MKNPFKKTVEVVKPYDKTPFEPVKGSDIVRLSNRIDEVCNDIDELRRQLNRIERKVYRNIALDKEEYNNKDTQEDNSWVKGLK